MDTDERTRLRALCERADLAPCEAFRDDNTGLWTVRERGAPPGEVVAEVPWTDIEPLRDCGATEARARLFAQADVAILALIDTVKVTEECRDVLAAKAAELRAALDAAEARAVAAERERDALRAELRRMTAARDALSELRDRALALAGERSRRWSA